jgi:hypothetical protein
MALLSFTVQPMSSANTSDATPTSSAEHEEVAPFGSDHGNLEFLKTRLPAWYLNAPKSLRVALHQSQFKSQLSRQTVEPIRSRLTPIETFATPLLTQALFDRFKLRLDVTANQLVTMHHDDYLLLRLRTPFKQTLLQAALQNFEAAETVAGSFNSGSALLPVDGLQTQLIWAPDFRSWIPRFRYRYSGVIDIKPEQFAQLARTLDLGGQYQTHLDSVFKPATPTGQADDQAARDVASAFMNSERDAIEVLTHIARMKNDISADVYSLLLEMVRPDGSPRWHGAAMRYRQLHMLDTYAFSGSSLSGALLIEPDLEGEDLPCVVYMPGEPITPIKEYESFTAFIDELRDRLASSRYQQYFRRFVSLEQSHLFFAKLNERLNIRPAPFTERILPLYVYDHDAELYLQKREIDKPVFEFLYEQLVSKTYQDSRVIAVPTSDEDRKSRLKRWQAFESAGMDLLMVAGFFVPVLGAVMAVVAAGQLLHEAFVAVEDWTHGETQEALNHVFAIGENLAAMAALGAAVHFAPRILPSPFIESLSPVKLRNGLTRLWKSDLVRFQQKVTLPSWVPADVQGRLMDDGKSWLPLDGKLYRIELDPALNKWRVTHPTDPELHSPLLEHNGVGAWRHEGENPMAWDEVKAFKRLNAVHQQFSEQAAQRVLRITGADDALLRQVHVENLPPPALLSDTAQRFVIEQQVEEFISLMSRNQVDQLDVARIEPFLNLLVSAPRWPQTQALSLLDGEGAVLARWNVSPATTATTQVVYARGSMNSLLESLLDGLGEGQLKTLLGESVTGKSAQVERLAKVLSELAETAKGQLLKDIYQLGNQSQQPLVKLIRRDFPSLPDHVAHELLKGISVAQRNRMISLKRMPLPLAEQAREYLQQLRLNRANEGFYLKMTDNPDTFTAGLGLLSSLPGWPADVAIELREGTYDGAPLEVAGNSQGARTCQVMGKTAAGYQPFDNFGSPVGPADQSFFSALLHVLPEAERRAIGLSAQPSVAELKVLLGDHAVTQRGKVAQLLGMQKIKPGFTWPHRLADGRVGYPMSGRLRRMFDRLRSGASDYSPELAIKTLYPGFIDAEVQAMLSQLRAEHTGQAWEFNAFAKGRLKALAKEYGTLESVLDQWLEDASVFEEAQRWESNYDAKSMAASRIKLCWKKMGMRRYDDTGAFIGYELDLSDLSIESLPELNMSFEHVGILRAQRLELTAAAADRFLARFGNLRHLELDDNLLSSIPAALGQCTQLERLSLSDNPLALDLLSAQHLGNLAALKELNLNRCPIGPLLDVSAFNRLRVLGARGTGIDRVPGGLWSRVHLQLVDLRDNQIASLSDSILENLTRVHVRIQLHDNPLDESSLLRAANILDPALRTRIGIGDAWVHAGTSPASGEMWMAQVAGQDLQARRSRWDDLETEPNAADFFRVLHDLTHSSDFAHYQQTLSMRVWAMLDAIADNQVLREELYSLAAHPQTCGDGVALVFSDLELHVRIFNIMAAPERAGHSAEMFKLVRGMARLDEVEKIALENIRVRELMGETVDHVEVRVAYRIGLAQRLKLPEQIQGMVFAALARVSRPMLVDAERRVLALESQPGFTRNLVAREFWTRFLETRFAEDFATINAPFHEQLDALLAPDEGRLTDGEYLQQIATIQKAREAAVQAYAVKMTHDIALQVARLETPPGTTVGAFAQR